MLASCGYLSSSNAEHPDVAPIKYSLASINHKHITNGSNRLLQPLIVPYLNSNICFCTFNSCPMYLVDDVRIKPGK